MIFLSACIPYGTRGKKELAHATCTLAMVAYAHLRKKREDNIVQVARGVKVSNVTSAPIADIPVLRSG